MGRKDVKMNILTPSFKGRFIDGKYFETEDVKLAEKFLKSGKIPSVDDFRTPFGKYFDSEGTFHVAPKDFSSNPTRKALSTATLGLFEALNRAAAFVEAYVRTLLDDKTAARKYAKIRACMDAIVSTESKNSIKRVCERILGGKKC